MRNWKQASQTIRTIVMIQSLAALKCRTARNRRTRFPLMKSYSSCNSSKRVSLRMRRHRRGAQRIETRPCPFTMNWWAQSMIRTGNNRKTQRTTPSPNLSSSVRRSQPRTESTYIARVGEDEPWPNSTPTWRSVTRRFQSLRQRSSSLAETTQNAPKRRRRRQK